MAAKRFSPPAGGFPWRKLRQLCQGLALGGFLLLVWALPSAAPAWLRQLPMQLDPLAALAQAVARRGLAAGTLLGLFVLSLSLLFGRGWCGWVCPLGTLLELFEPRRLLPKKRLAKRSQGARLQPPDSWRRLKYLLLLAVLAAALLGSTTLLVFDPLTILLRGLAGGLFPALDGLARLAESDLYRVPALRPAVTALDQWLRPALLPVEPLAARSLGLMLAVLGGVLALNLLASRFWCRYVCPLGALLGFFSRPALLQRRVADDCKACGLCAGACPTGTIQPERGYRSDPAECTLCLDCEAACPRGSIRFHSPELSLAAHRQDYDPQRRELLVTLGGALAGGWLAAQPWAAPAPTALHPPGASTARLTEACLRCGACLRACPTGALQPALLEAGLHALWTPVLALRLGYCDYACNTCGMVCPVEAIPPLDLAEKRQQVIGAAFIDQQRCLAWRGESPCIVCEEMCPVPEKAITLALTRVQAPSGEWLELQTPAVHPRRCIGCGICEYKCPVEGEAAVRVGPAVEQPGMGGQGPGHGQGRGQGRH